MYWTFCKEEIYVVKLAAFLGTHRHCLKDLIMKCLESLNSDGSLECYHGYLISAWWWEVLTGTVMNVYKVA